MTDQDKAVQEAERIAAADEYFKARPWLMDTNDNRRIFEAGFDRAYALLSKLRAPVADERHAVDPCGYVAVKSSAVDWLKDKFPALTIKAGLCERIGGRLYTITRLMCDHDAALASAPVVDERVAEHVETLRRMRADYKPSNGPMSALKAAALDVALCALASAPVVHPACPTDVCQAAKADGVLCANDECDRSNGVRPASAPVAGEAQPTDAEIIDLAVEPLGIDCDRMPHGVVVFARNLLSRYAAPQASEAVRDALMAFDEAMSLCNDFPELQHHRDALLFAVQKARAALSAQPGAQRSGGGDAE